MTSRSKRCDGLQKFVHGLFPGRPGTDEPHRAVVKAVAGPARRIQPLVRLGRHPDEHRIGLDRMGQDEGRSHRNPLGQPQSHPVGVGRAGKRAADTAMAQHSKPTPYQRLAVLWTWQ